MRMLCALLISCLAVEASAQSVAEPVAPRQRELIRMVRQDCGSCHGMTLKGGLGLPLLPETLRDKPASSLVATVVHGRPGTPMPAWKTILAEGEAEWIVSHLMRGFPDE